jgi:hypothetical protein
MTQGGTSEHLAADVLAMSSLASRQDLAQRVRNVLGGVLGLFWRNLERSLSTSLDEFERHLIQQANKPKVGEAGSRALESVRRMKPTRGDLGSRFMLSLEDDLARFDQRVASTAAKKPALTLSHWQDLSLVGSSELDESLTLSEMASRVELRHTLPLYELGYRYGVLAGRAAFDAESLPLGPARITSALRYAVAGLDLPLDHRVLFYQTFERFAMSGIGALYAAANTYMAEQGILRHLQIQALTKARAPSGPPPAEAKAGAADAARDTHGPPRPRPGSSGPEIDVGGFGLAAFEVASTSAPTRATSAPPLRETRITAPKAEPEDRGDDAFSVLRSKLAALHGARGVMAAPKTIDAYEPGARDVQSALNVLQVRSPPTIMLGGKIVQRTLAQLRQDLLNQLRHVTPAGQTPRLSDHDSDTIDIVGMLFEQLMQATRPNGRTQSMLTRLQVPLLRVALRDKRVFFDADHSARRLLNSIADVGTHWVDDGAVESDPILIERMQRAVDRINGEFDTDMRVFEQVNDEFQLYAQSLVRKAEVSERRLVEAARGREKLAMARDTATRAITIRMATAKPSRLLRTLLEQAWTDVLALTVLRQGEKSDTYRKQLAVADQLIGAGRIGPAAFAGPLAAEWREGIESGLAQVGYHVDEIQAVVTRLFAGEPADDDDHAISQTDLAMRLKSKMRFGEGAGEETALHAPPRAKPALNEQELQMLERVKALAFGTAFEVTGTQGDVSRLKLAWFSPMTGRCLLVNQRGARVDERGLEQLARDLAGARLRFVAAESENLIDRCWRAVEKSLDSAAATARNAGL